MLEAMRQAALDMLCNELGNEAVADPEAWYHELRRKNAGTMFQWLIESSEKMDRYYTLRASHKDSQMAILEVHDFKIGDKLKLPFNQPTGAQSAALGPVIKRTWKQSEKRAGPTLKIQSTTLQAFNDISQEKNPWSAYFNEVADCLQRGKVHCAWDGKILEVEEGYTSFGLAISAIPEKKTVFLAVKDSKGRLPGDVPQYVEYLQKVLPETKYTTSKTQVQPERECPLCGEMATVFPNALKGAGLNISNVDREGAFPGIAVEAAWKGYALCGACADLLYIYKYHVAPKLYATIAGEKSLVIPFTQTDPALRQKFTRRTEELVKGITNGEEAIREERLMRLLGEDVAVTSLTFLWAQFGQSIDEVKGILTDILPSRLRRIEELNREIRVGSSPMFPQIPIDEFSYDLRLSILRPLFKRPGGKKATALNASKRLFDLKHELAAAIYHGRLVDPKRFWDEVLLTARWLINDAAQHGDGWGLLYEGFSEKKMTPYLTAAGWVRQLAKFLHYLRKGGVMPMPDEIYQPKSEALKPYFSLESALDSKEKAFAFILGVLYGKVLQVQAARRVNVGANALTWLKRLTLTGKDLPDLYVKVRGKLLAYETESNATVREIVAELGALGARIGDQIHLDDVQTCYYLLLGQSLATTIMPKKDNEKSEGDNQ